MRTLEVVTVLFTGFMALAVGLEALLAVKTGVGAGLEDVDLISSRDDKSMCFVHNRTLTRVRQLP